MILLVLALVSGAINPAVTQSNIDSTICVRGWTRSIRPPEQFTYELKRQQIHQFHLSGRPSDYEEDHLVPLELGGAPTNVHNLWPEPWADARIKDDKEYALHEMVCARKLPLAVAQRIMRNWK